MFNVSQFIDPQSINFKSLPPVKHLCDLHLNIILLVFSEGCLHTKCSPEITLTDADVSLIPFWGEKFLTFRLRFRVFWVGQDQI